MLYIRNLKFEEDITLFINQDIYKKIEQCIDKAYPNEACGLIYGKIEEIKKINFEDDYSYYYYAKKFECIESSFESPVAFLMDDYLKLKEISEKFLKVFNLQLISIFHSHPGGAYPSGVDIPYMRSYHEGKITKFKHIIWTIMDAQNKELNGFIYLFDELRQINIDFLKK